MRLIVGGMEARQSDGAAGDEAHERRGAGEGTQVPCVGVGGEQVDGRPHTDGDQRQERGADVGLLSEVLGEEDEMNQAPRAPAAVRRRIVVDIALLSLFGYQSRCSDGVAPGMPAAGRAAPYHALHKWFIWLSSREVCGIASPGRSGRGSRVRPHRRFRPLAQSS